MSWLRRRQRLRRQRLRGLQRMRRLQILPLRRRLRWWLWGRHWLWRWLDRRAGSMHGVLCIMGTLPLVLESSAP